MYYHRNAYTKHDYNSHRKDEMTEQKSIFLKSSKFDKTNGTWVLLKDNREIKQTSDIETLENDCGDYIKNDTHFYGYKFNRLYKQWKLYDFKNNEYM